MEILNSSVTLISHLIFIAMTHQVLRNLFDWSKVIKNTLRISDVSKFYSFVEYCHYYMVSHFILEIITVSQTFFFGFQ